MALKLHLNPRWLLIEFAFVGQIDCYDIMRTHTALE